METDYACDKFVPQKWRRDVCRSCYQPRRMHSQKSNEQPLDTKKATAVKQTLPKSTAPPKSAEGLSPRDYPVTGSSQDPSVPRATVEQRQHYESASALKQQQISGDTLSMVAPSEAVLSGDVMASSAPVRSDDVKGSGDQVTTPKEEQEAIGKPKPTSRSSTTDVVLLRYEPDNDDDDPSSQPGEEEDAIFSPTAAGDSVQPLFAVSSPTPPAEDIVTLPTVPPVAIDNEKHFTPLAESAHTIDEVIDQDYVVIDDDDVVKKKDVSDHVMESVMEADNDVTEDDVVEEDNDERQSGGVGMAAAIGPPLPGAGIPAPPPPPWVPPLQAPPVAAGNDRGSLLKEIATGTQLKNVPWPQQKPVGEVEVTNFQTELQRISLRKQREEITTAAQLIDTRKKEIDDLIGDIIGSARHAQRLMFLKMLQKRILELTQSDQMLEDMLPKRRHDWPAHQVSALAEVIDYMNRLEAKVQGVEDLCQKSFSTINPEAVERCSNELVRLAMETGSNSRFSMAFSSFPVSQTDIDGLMLRATNALAPLLDKLYEKAFTSYMIVTDGTVGKFDLKFRLTNAQRLLKMCCKITDSLSNHLRTPRHPSYSEAQLKMNELKELYTKSIVQEQSMEEAVILKSSEVPRNPDSLPRKKRESFTGALKLVQSIKAGDTAANPQFTSLLDGLTDELYRVNEVQLIRAAVSSKNLEVVQGVARLRDRFAGDDDALKHRHDFDWLCEAISLGFPRCMVVLVQEHGVAVNAQSTEAAQTPMHIAARKLDYSSMLQLLRLGGDPLAINGQHQTPLQLVAIKRFPICSVSKVSETKELLFDLAAYLFSENLSDVTLVSSDGRRFPAHRLVLCAQSNYFKTLLDSDLWQEGKQKEVTIPTVEGPLLQIMLEYMYTGKCLFPRDDLNKAIELMATAEMFLLQPMKAQCETLLSDKLNHEVVLPVYRAAFHYSPSGNLCNNCCGYILRLYKDLEDTDNEVLYQILEHQASL